MIFSDPENKKHCNIIVPAPLRNRIYVIRTKYVPLRSDPHLDYEATTAPTKKETPTSPRLRTVRLNVMQKRLLRPRTSAHTSKIGIEKSLAIIDATHKCLLLCIFKICWTDDPKYARQLVRRRVDRALGYLDGILTHRYE